MVNISSKLEAVQQAKPIDWDNKQVVRKAKYVIEESMSKDFDVQYGEILYSETSTYLIQCFIGEGYFGKVAKCVDLITKQVVALKISKAEKCKDTEREIKMLKALSVLDPGKTNLVEFFENFEHKGHECLAFEMLDQNIQQLIKNRFYKPLSVSEIRPIAHQLLTALDALRGLGIIHCDLKPDNIMLVNHRKQPYKIKLIDFGMSRKTSQVKRGIKIMPVGYRAPEVSLGLPITTAIDIWGLGCVLSFLYLSRHLFDVHSEYQMMRSIVRVVGIPADKLLKAGKFTKRFFKVKWNKAWTLKTPKKELKKVTGIVPKKKWPIVQSLDQLETIYLEFQDYIEFLDRREFVSLLKCLLHTNPKQRITPAEALQHPFITMTHIMGDKDTSLYVKGSIKKMDCLKEVLKDGFSDDGITYLAASFGKILVLKTDDPRGKISDKKSEGKPKAVGCQGILSSDSASPLLFEGSTNLPEETAAAGAESGPAKEEAAVDQDVRHDPAEETLAPNGSPDKGASVKKRKYLFKRFPKLPRRTIRAMFRFKRTK